MLLLPFVLYAGARYPPGWAAVSVAVAALVLITATTRGRNPFGVLLPRNAVIQAQELILIMSLMTLGLAALLSQLRARRLELETANRRLHELNDHLETRVQQRTAELSRANQQLTTLAVIDPLTAVYNRRGFLDVAQRELARAHRSGRPLAVVLFDLDHFKTVNDCHGHLAGDETLKQFAATLRRATRPGDTCARYGGEEFVVLAPETDLNGGQALAQRIVDAMRTETIHWGTTAFNVTVSAGVALVDDRETGLSEGLQRADVALYDAKARGRNRVQCAAPPASVALPAATSR